MFTVCIYKPINLDETGSAACVPRLRQSDQDMVARDWIQDFSAGYMQRDMHLLPKQGDRAPWINTQNYFADIELIRNSPVADEILEFLPALEAAE